MRAGSPIEWVMFGIPPNEKDPASEETGSFVPRVPLGYSLRRTAPRHLPLRKKAAQRASGRQGRAIGQKEWMGS